MRHIRQAAAVTAVALLATLAAWAPAAAGATPGEHLWADWVFISDVFEDEEATAVAIAPGDYPVTVGTAVATTGAATDIRYVSYETASSIWRWNAVPLTWDGPAGGADTAAGVVTDTAGDAYIAGTTTVPGGTRDIVVLKILGVGQGGSSGSLLWAERYGGSAGKDDEAEAIAMDAAGSVYVTGGSTNAAGSMDVVTVKFRPDGTKAWSRRLDSPSKKLDRGLAIAVCGTSVYVAGVSRRTGHADDVVLIRYSTDGARTWVRYYDDPLHRSETVAAIACAGSAVYVCGAGKVGVVSPGDALLLKYSAKGARTWARYAGGKAGDDSWSEMAVDGKARVHVAGTFFRKTTADDVTTSVYYPSGKLQWQAGFSSSGSRLDTGQALAVDSSRRTYVCGSIEGSAGASDAAVLCYGAGGTRQWFSRYPDPAGYPLEVDLGDDRAVDIALTGTAVYVAGATTVYHPLSGGGAGGDTLDFFTAKLAR